MGCRSLLGTECILLNCLSLSAIALAIRSPSCSFPTHTRLPGSYRMLPTTIGSGGQWLLGISKGSLDEFLCCLCFRCLRRGAIDDGMASVVLVLLKLFPLSTTVAPDIDIVCSADISAIEPAAAVMRVYDGVFHCASCLSSNSACWGSTKSSS